MTRTFPHMRFILPAFLSLVLMSQASYAAGNSDRQPEAASDRQPEAASNQQQQAASGQPQPSTDQQLAVREVEGYLNSITTLKAHFVQTDNEGKQQTGTFYLDRPGKMRIDYDPPDKDFIVADGALIYYYDGKMKQQSSAPLSRSLANFFLRTDLKISGDISASDVKRQNNTLQMTLTQTRNPLAGSLTLMLSERPLQLLAWRIVDAQGLVTEVRLTDIEMGNPLDSALFHYYDPNRKAHLYNRE